MPAQVFDGLPVQLYSPQVYVLPTEQVLREHSHAGAYLQHVSHPAAVIKRVHNRFGHALIRKEMLPEGFLGSYFHISCICPFGKNN